MLTDREFKELLDFQPKHPVLSVYLNVDSARQPAEAYRLQLRSMLKDLPLNGNGADSAAIERYLEHEYGWTGRSLAIFSSAADGFFRAFSLQVPLRSRARLMPEPYLKPLADLLDSYGGYGVALADKQGVRVFHFHLGELREQEGTLGEVVKQVKRGRNSTRGQRGGRVQSPGGGRHTEEVVARNMRDSAQFAADFFADKQVRRILLGGTDENLAQFRAELPRSLQALVMGTFHMDMNASHDEVLRRAMQVAEEAEARSEAKLVQTVITAAAKGQDGVVGLADTLSAAHAGRVMTLLLSEGYRAPGYQCGGCGYLAAQSADSCPFCGGAFNQIEDAVEFAVRKVMRDGGEVEIVRSPELQAAGGIGGLLRY